MIQILDYNIIIPKEKITKYLLDFESPDGFSKAKFFHHFGFDKNNWIIFRDALYFHLRESENFEMIEFKYGVKLRVRDKILTPSGKTPNILSVWHLIEDEKQIRLITAHPYTEKES